VKIYVAAAAAVEALKKTGRKDRMKLNLPQKIGGKTILAPSYFAL
jgi:hypothetical protein